MVSLQIKNEAGKTVKQECDKLIIAASFTAEPLRPGLEFWMDRLELRGDIEFAPYNQIFQELLNPESAFGQNVSGMNVVLVKFDDWLRYVKGQHELDGGEEDYLRKTFVEFTGALEAFRQRSSVFTLLIVCPPSPAYSHLDWFSRLANEFEDQLGCFFQSGTGMGWIKGESVLRSFGVEEFFDSFTDELGHVPYTTGYYNVLATVAARWFYSLRHAPSKVIILDCDNTLWAGICGEEGPDGVRIEGLFKTFQEFLLEKVDQGFLLCLCSKNDEEDVWNTFEKNSGMVLKREHIVDFRINWISKSENIRSLAAHLNLGLDSFVFIDDNPVEIAEVRFNCPEVLCIQWPPVEGDESFLHHIWTLDKFIVTTEDKTRAESYKANVEREKLLQSSANFSDFIESLGLQVTIGSMPAGALARVSQLTGRTNQFNFTTIRRENSEIQVLLEEGNHECLIAEVKDRFGDYGIVGVMILKIGERALTLDTFLLSCRVLGRGVEYKMMAHLGNMAVEKKIPTVTVSYRKSPKNEPARLFLEKIAPAHAVAKEGENFAIQFPASELAKLEYRPSHAGQEKIGAPDKKKASSVEPAPIGQIRKREEMLVTIAAELSSAQKLEREIHLFVHASFRNSVATAAVARESGDYEAFVLDRVRKAFSLALHIPPAELDLEAEIDSYIQRNSLKIVEITSLLHKDFKTIPTTLLFERRTIKNIVSAIVNARQGVTAGLQEKVTERGGAGRTIAIIGMNGRFPRAATIEEFWRRLAEGVDCVTEVPLERWDANAYFAPGDIPGKSYCKWGGFVSDVDRFEAPFFHISPREAEMMDPQQRLFLEVVWGLFEDAGYTHETISRNTGVFVGIIASDYNTISSGAALRGECAYRGSDYYQIPNRISYFFDFRGPSIAVDTACSASGVGIYLACQSLRQGDCDMAIAGGVNVFLHPSRFVQYSRMKILSPQGVCRPFGEGADGTVMGEGIAAVLLKPLSKAEPDGDHIYAVIKGGAINSGGKTNGFTVPNPLAQADLVETALRDAGVDPATVSYIETHGTGTSLGDPIELRGLSEAFTRNWRADEGPIPYRCCALGSVKSNIGHLESAAAVAGLIKILLQMKHRLLVPSLNARIPNPAIDFGKSPFYVQQTLAEWLPKGSSEENGMPLRAGLSSFGAGGVNVHFIIEEYIDNRERPLEENGRFITVLSSVTAERLAVSARELLEFLSDEDTAQRISLADLAYTLQTGRQPMKERLALVAGSMAECRELLRKFVNGEFTGRSIFRGNAGDGNVYSDLLLEGREGKEYLQILVQDRKFEKLAQLWVSGAAVDWMVFYPNGGGRRVPLPVFRFLGDRYWIPGEESETTEYRLHPLLDGNVSTFLEQCFRKTLTVRDFTIRDHVLDRQMVLPGVAYLEMARAAGSLSNQAKPVKVIRNIVWSKPVILDNDACDLFVGLRPKKNSTNGFDVEGRAYTIGRDGEHIDHARWTMAYGEGCPAPGDDSRLDVERIIDTCGNVISAKECYRLLERMGFQYRHCFQVIHQLRYNEKFALARLELPQDMRQDEGFVLHPSLMDGALQSVVAWMSDSKRMPGGLLVPFTMGEVEILHPLEKSCYVVSTETASRSGAKPDEANVRKFDVTIYNDDGRAAVRIREHYLRCFQQPEQASLMYIDAAWMRAPIDLPEGECVFEGDLLLFCLSSELAGALEQKKGSGNSRLTAVTPGPKFREIAEGRYEINRESLDDYRMLVKALRHESRLPRKIIHAWSAADFDFNEESLTDQLHSGFYSIFYVSRAFMELEPTCNLELLYVYWLEYDMPQPQYAAVGGMARSILRENPRFRFKTLALDRGLAGAPRTADIILWESTESTQPVGDVKWQREQRFVREYVEMVSDEPSHRQIPSPDRQCFKRGGAYLITGGAGELGLVIAEYLGREFNARLALCGRSDLTEEKQKRIDYLNTLGGEAVYFPTDISRREEVKELVAAVRSRFGAIDGIIHSAGAIRDSLLVNKKRQEIDAVLGPKVYGAMLLDDETRDGALDFFMIFSSISSRIGYMGQLDYAYANRYLDEFSDLRRILVKRKQRSGKTISINWPYWASGGMQMDNATIALHRKSMGLWGLENDEGIAILQRIAAGPDGRFMVIKGDRRKILGLIQDSGTPAPSVPTAGTFSNVKLENDLRQMIFDILKIPKEHIESDKELSHLGFDSLTFTDFANKINERFQVDISPAVYYEHRSFRAFAGYLETEFPDALAGRYASPAAVPVAAFRHDTGLREYVDPEPEQIAQVIEPVAIIGVSAVLPGAADTEEFWNNLMAAKDAIGEIPAGRWDWRGYFGRPGEDPWGTDVKWGGFIEDVDKFDAAFFGISPREAMMMDPQQRIFLENAWKAIEDAGYGPLSLGGTDTGVFVGVSINDYNELMKDWSVAPDAFISTGINNSIIANRVSYLLDLRGPSEIIDTACSSSLVCVRHAVDCIRAGDCGMALVGAVNIMLRPKFHIAFRKTGILSGEGRCKTFDKHADGYVRAEGAAAILLKPLSRAVADGDHIYAVIKGIAENHGGRAQSLTAPNPNAQADVITRAYRNAGVSCYSIGYIETHGTGTRLGDPIEVNGLKKAFAQAMADDGGNKPVRTGYCGLGAVKTNVGHLEAVAGLAGMIKVLYAMKYRLIPASIHQHEQNPLIDLSGSPFYIVNRHTPWERLRDEAGNPLPLRAGISSFGFGGTNAHIVLEEYPAQPPEDDGLPAEPYLFVLSAKTKERLKEYAGRLLVFLREGGLYPESLSSRTSAEDIRKRLSGFAAEILQVEEDDIDAEENIFDMGFDPVLFAEFSGFVSAVYSVDLSAGDFTDTASIASIARYISRSSTQSVSGAEQTAGDVPLRDIAYTLQVGRDAMDERLAIVAATQQELEEKLEAYRSVEGASGPLFMGLKDMPADHRLETFGRLWAGGGLPDWHVLYAGKRPRRVSLPVYPFARERHWLTEPVAYLHPLVHVDNSNAVDTRFTTVLSGEEFFLRDHVVSGKKILPGVAYFEMARAAGEVAFSRHTPVIRNMVWSRPAVADGQPLELDILLSPGRKGVDFQVVSGYRGPSRIVHAAGILLLDGNEGGLHADERIVVDSVKSRCSRIVEHHDFYRIFSSMGIVCGPGFRPIQRIYCGSGEALAEIQLPVAVKDDVHRYVLHPTLIDGSLQAIVGLLDRQEIDLGTPYLPFTAGELRMTGPLPAECYAYVTVKAGTHSSGGAGRRFDISLLDRSGRPLATIHDYIVRFLKERLDETPVYYAPAWKTSPLEEEDWLLSGNIVVWGADERLVKRVGAELSFRASETSRIFQVTAGENFATANDNDFRVNPLETNDFSLVIRELVAICGGIDWVVLPWDGPAEEAGNRSIQEYLDYLIKPVFYLEKALLNENAKRRVRHVFFRFGSLDDSLDSAYFNALSGLARAVHLENDGFTFSVVDYRGAGHLASGGIEVLIRELRPSAGVRQVSYLDGRRAVKMFEAFPAGQNPISGANFSLSDVMLREEGVYIVTGGAGGLGIITSEFLAKHTKGKLALTGRSEMSPAIEDVIRKLDSLGSRAVYIQADVSVEADVRRLVAEVEERFGSIHGIFHCAGLINDRLLKGKTPQEIQRVLQPKVNGTILLDRCTKDLPLELFVLYSSVSGALGNTGQSDYAYANCFMDHFAFVRNDWSQKGLRRGRTISVNWPYWLDGGMRLDGDTERFLASTWGMVPLDTKNGLAALAIGLKVSYPQFMVLNGNRDKIVRWIDSQFAEKLAAVNDTASADEIPDESAIDGFQEDMMVCFSKLLGIGRDKIGAEDKFDKLGLSSIVFVDMANQLNGRYGLEVMPSVFFQFSSPRQVINFLFSTYKNNIAHYYNRSDQKIDNRAAMAEPDMQERRLVASGAIREDRSVAIIGMSGHMPQSPDLETFWKNLVQKKDLVTKIDPARWESLGLKDQPFDRPAAIGAEWGGFLDDIGMFDAGFFHISRREAELMDPQQRLFLETVWKTVENAGYRASDLSGTRTGVFVGVANNDYFDVIRDSAQTLEAYVTTGNEHSVLANRISFLLDLKGPSEPVNTACSSSLVALANAVHSLRTGRCDLAIAGGVNVISSRGFFITVSDGGMLSKEGRCKSFDSRADGYVRGEGVGALLLKPLARAIADRDHVHAVIKGCAVNHGGRVSSLTVPNASAQAALIEEAIADAGIPLWSVGYIEAHGTGTELGDPIEFDGLATAYRRMVATAGERLPVNTRIGIGSVKANVGHLEAAAGIAGVMKAILSLQRKKIPGLAHFQTLNPYITTQDTPFYVAKDTIEWQRLEGDGGMLYPRRVGVSSFGFGGANAHVILEEYPVEALPPEQSRIPVERPRLIVLSARDEGRLRHYARNVAEYLEEFNAGDSSRPIPDLADIAYTLQVGRESMAARLAVIVSLVGELTKKLRDFVGGKDGIENVFFAVGEGNTGMPARSGPGDVPELGLGSMAKNWVNGADVDWLSLYTHEIPKRVPMPTYPFLRQRYWVAAAEQKIETKKRTAAPAAHLWRILWRKSELPSKSCELGWGLRRCVLVFDEDRGIVEDMQQSLRLSDSGETSVVWVRPGECFNELETDVFTIDPANQEDYERLFDVLEDLGLRPESILHLWCRHDRSTGWFDVDKRLSRGIYSVFNVTQSLLRLKNIHDTRIVFAYENRPDGIEPLYAAVGGFALSLAQENPHIYLKCVGFPPHCTLDVRFLAGVLARETVGDAGWDVEVCYREDGRFIKRLEKLGAREDSSCMGPELKHRGVYVITGGTGGLGMIFARYLAGRAQGRLILTGRGHSDEAKLRLIEELRALGGDALYLKADVSSKEDIALLAAEIEARFGRLDGIIHAAGVLDDAFVINKSPEGMKAVLSPKVMGAINLDDAFGGGDLDFFVLFSSVASVLGNSGQCDYAYANSFLDYFAALRRGRTFSINWPLWQDGGMRADPHGQEMFSAQWGIVPMPTEAGLQAFEDVLLHDVSQIVVAYGADDSFAEKTANVQRREIVRAGTTSIDSSALRQGSLDYLKGLISQLIKLPLEEIDENTTFGEMGIDSFMINKFNSVAGHTFDRLPKTLLFEYRNLAELLEYFLDHYKDRLVEISGIQLSATESSSGDEANDWRQVAMNKKGEQFLDAKDIAIIGVGGRYPGAADLDGFWSNIRSGKDCITEIPTERWDVSRYFHPDPDMASEGKIYCKWGGFIDDVDKFDHEFFNISPREAELIDPQERLFLETAWKTLEDAGYTRRKLSGKNAGGKERGVGVFVGVTTNDYPLLAAAEWQKGRIVNPRSYPWSVANRVSFFFDFRGPSIPVDTGCSSSLTAIYLACQSISRGECSLALAGGVNVYLHPAKYIQMCAMRMLSPRGRCHTFGAGADGFVPGEGVGAVLLRPLTDARKNGDHIYGVIKGGAINHGGATNGYTVPNPRAQAELIRDALENSGVDPRTISYIEAHGTGTSLGDPIEIEGLAQAYGAYCQDLHYCAVGSVKSNIGHLESAAGIAGVTKILLQMKYGKLAPSLHAETLNPNIDFSHSQFYVQTGCTEWRKAQGSPRRSAISSFGAGGTNVHLIIEDYHDDECDAARPVSDEPTSNRHLVVLSAKHEAQLKLYAERLLNYLSSAEAVDISGHKPVSPQFNSVLDSLVECVAGISGSQVCDIDSDTDIADFGLDLVEFNRLADLVNDRYSLELDAEGFLTGLSIHSLAELIVQKSTGIPPAVTDNNRLCCGFSPDFSLADVAYTLQVGREAMDERLGIVASDLSGLKRALQSYCVSGGGDGSGNIFRGNARKPKGTSSIAHVDPPSGNVVRDLIRERDLSELCRLWVSGVEVNWPLLYLSERPQPGRISLPTYPFQKNRCWIGSGPTVASHEATLPAAIAARPVVVRKPDLEQISSRFLTLLADVLYMKPEAIDETKPFVELGLDSVLGVELVNKVGKEFKVLVRATNLYDHSSVVEFSEFLAGLVGEIEVTSPATGEMPAVATVSTIQDSGAGRDIAVIGMSARLPGADDIRQYWKNMESGVCSVVEVPSDRWNVDEHFDPDPSASNKSYCKWGGFLRDIDAFDSLFFNISPAEAASLEPQQRLFLQEAWRALEHAGYSANMLDNLKCGVYVGVMSYNEYNPFHLFNSTSILSARIAYFLNLKGPALSIDTACSSSLVALHLACKNLVEEDADMMVVGGVTLYLSEKQYIQMSRSGMLSHDGKCRTFDDAADGFVPGEGVAAVVLKKLSRALEDRDYIHGVIKGSNINQDGRTNGITAPSARSQSELEVSVYEACNINPETISYVEAHGTGTNLGDPIELEALAKSFGRFTQKRRFCGIGSVKTNLGHTSASAGLASLIKVLLSMQHREIPASLFFKTPNRHIDFENSPFYVVTELQDWRSKNGAPRRSAVSSFGFSGTNAHIIVEEAPVERRNESSKTAFLIVFSARTEDSLKMKVQEFGEWLDDDGASFGLGDISYTLLAGRSHFDWRLAFIARGMDQLRRMVNKLATDGLQGCPHMNRVPDNSPKKNSLAYEKGILALAGLQKSSNGEDYVALLEELADLYLAGVSLDWETAFAADDVHRIPMPAYPFAKKRHWLVSSPEQVVDANNDTPVKQEKNIQEKAVAALHEILARKNPKAKSGDDPAPTGKLILNPTRAMRSQAMDQLTKRAVITLRKPPGGGEEESPANGFKAKVKATVSKVLCLDVSEIADHKRLADLGMDSIIGVELVKELNRDLQIAIKKEALYEYPSVDELSRYLIGLVEKKNDEQRA